MSRIQVTGEVTRVFGKGFDMTEKYTSRDGREFSQRFTVWTSDSWSTGDVVAVEGDLSLSVEEWTGRDNQTRHSVKASINRPTVSVAQRAQEAQGRTNDSWASGGTYNDSEPF